MDLRGSSSSKASGSRVSAIPPDPTCFSPSKMAVEVRPNWAAGAKAWAEAIMAAMTASLYCNFREMDKKARSVLTDGKLHFSIETCIRTNSNSTIPVDRSSGDGRHPNAYGFPC